MLHCSIKIIQHKLNYQINRNVRSGLREWKRGLAHWTRRRALGSSLHLEQHFWPAKATVEPDSDQSQQLVLDVFQWQNTPANDESVEAAREEVANAAVLCPGYRTNHSSMALEKY